MRLFGIGLAALLAAATLAPAMSADRAAGVDKKAVERGMKEAPAAVAAAGLSCTVTDARFIGENKDPKTKILTAYYEVACQQGLGFVVASGGAPGAPPVTTTCVDTQGVGADGKPNPLACVLPGNANPSAGLAPLIAKAGSTCVPTRSRGIGASPTNAFFEVACQNGDGYIIQSSTPPDASKEVVLSTCLAYEPGTRLACSLTDPAVLKTTLVKTLVSGSGKACDIKDSRYILTTKSGSNFIEVACNDGKGYVLEQNVAGQLARTIDCSQADFVGGGCRLTDSRAAQTEQAGLYTRLAKKIGFNCDVEKYGILPSKGGSEVVELKCSNRPDGAIASFTSNGGQIYDCAHAEIAGFRCAFTKADLVYSSLTADLKGLGKSTCTVSNARYVGTTGDGRGFNEVACSDGLPGFMIEYGPRPEVKPKTTIACGSAGGIAGGCRLPGNIKK